MCYTFEVNHIKTENEEHCKVGCFSHYGKTTLMQEMNVHRFIPCKCLCDISIISDNDFLHDWCPTLKGPLEQLQSCIAPFLHKGELK